MLTAQSAKEFNLAIHRGTIEQWFNFFRGCSNELIAFEQAKNKFGLHNAVDRGIQEIKIDNILGSAGKQALFTRTFYPKQLESEQRWRQIDELFHGLGFSPIDVYKVGEAYFVQDGNHRVSVNRLHNIPTIEARVIEFDADVDRRDLEKLRSTPRLKRFVQQLLAWFSFGNRLESASDWGRC